MTLVQPHTHDGKRMGELSMVYYNNLLSLGPIAVLALWFGEVPRLRHQEALLNPEFLIVAVVGGLLGFLISFASLWFMSRSSATVFSLTVSRMDMEHGLVWGCIFLAGIVRGYVMVFQLYGKVKSYCKAQNFFWVHDKTSKIECDRAMAASNQPHTFLPCSCRAP